MTELLADQSAALHISVKVKETHKDVGTKNKKWINLIFMEYRGLYLNPIYGENQVICQAEPSIQVARRCSLFTVLYF